MATGEGKDHDIIKAPGVVLVGRVEHQLGGGLLPQVNEECGMDHRDSKTARPLPFPDQGVVQGPFVIALQTQQAGRSLQEICCKDAPQQKLSPSALPSTDGSVPSSQTLKHSLIGKHLETIPIPQLNLLSVLAATGNSNLPTAKSRTLQTQHGVPLALSKALFAFRSDPGSTAHTQQPQRALHVCHNST